MGSPILLFNTMLGINLDRVKQFANKNQNYTLKWLNIIHPSDIISYPLRASFCINNLDKLDLKDIYIDSKNNFVAKAARSINQDLAAMALDAIEAHTQYWNCSRTAQSIVDNLHGEEKSRNSNKKYLQEAIDRLQKVPGMSIDKIKFHINDEPIATIKFSDGSGKLFYIINAAKIHHIYVFNEKNICLFAGYVGWIHTKGLQQTIQQIETLYVDRDSNYKQLTIYL